MASITLALLRSALGRFLGRWYWTYWRSPGAVGRVDDVSALCQVQWGSRSLRVTVPQIQVRLSGFCPGHEVLELVRPVVPYTLALSSKRSRPVVPPASCRPVASQAPTVG